MKLKSPTRSGAKVSQPPEKSPRIYRTLSFPPLKNKVFYVHAYLSERDMSLRLPKSLCALDVLSLVSLAGRQAVANGMWVSLLRGAGDDSGGEVSCTQECFALQTVAAHRVGETQGNCGSLSV